MHVVVHVVDHVLEALEAAVGNDEVDLVGVAQDVHGCRRAHGFALKAKYRYVSEALESILYQEIQVLSFKAAHGACGFDVGAVASEVICDTGKAQIYIGCDELNDAEVVALVAVGDDDVLARAASLRSGNGSYVELVAVLAFNYIILFIIRVVLAPHIALLSVADAVIVGFELGVRYGPGSADGGADQVDDDEGCKADENDLKDLFLIDWFSSFGHTDHPTFLF